MYCISALLLFTFPLINLTHLSLTVVSFIHTRYQSNMAKEVLDTIMAIQPKDSSGGTGETRESIVYKIAQDMLEKLPPDYIPHEVQRIALNLYVMF